jgi:hypothetical protein
MLESVFPVCSIIRSAICSMKMLDRLALNENCVGPFREDRLNRKLMRHAQVANRRCK